MDYNNFKNELFNDISPTLKEFGVIIRKETRDKAMGGVTDVYTFQSSNNQEKSAVLEVHELYDIYMRNKDMIAVLDFVYMKMREAELIGEPPAKDLMKYDKVKHKIRFKAINYERNKEQLKGRPHKIKLDIALVYQVLFDGVIANITYDLLDAWKKKEEEVQEAALDNIHIEDYYQIMPVPMNSLPPDAPPIFFMTNKEMRFGASCLFFDEALKKAAEIVNDNIYIFPCDVNMVMFLSASLFRFSQSTRMIVSMMNSNILSSEDQILSDQVYFFDRKKMKLEICEEKTGYEK